MKKRKETRTETPIYGRNFYSDKRSSYSSSVLFFFKAFHIDKLKSSHPVEYGFIGRPILLFCSGGADHSEINTIRDVQPSLYSCRSSKSFRNCDR